MRVIRGRAGLTIVEVLAVVVAIALLLAALLPSIARAQNSSGVQQSMSNLAALGVSHVLYALDWEGRQVTWVKDDLGVYAGDVSAYNQAAGNCFGVPPPPECQPPIIAGRGCNGSLWGYWPHLGNRAMIQPLLFPDGPDSSSFAGWGHWRIPNARPFHNYHHGRYHHPTLYAPNDTLLNGYVAECIDEPCEYVEDVDSAEFAYCNPGWSSYAFSAAAMFHPDVWRSNAAGGWQAPWALDHGYEAPGLFQATYPSLKTHMLEHGWLQDPPAACNPAWALCEPFWFNHGIGSSPVTLFYDGTVRMLPNAEVAASDQQVLTQTGGVDGLWHRGTTFGEDGYFLSVSYDGTPLSHHVLTTDGILGRDTLGQAGPVPRVPRRPGNRVPRSFQQDQSAVLSIDWSVLTLTPEGEQP